MEDLDFSGKPAKPVRAKPAAASPQPEPVSLYDPKLALAFFRLGASQEQFPARTQIFVENEKAGGFFSKGARIYLLLEGEVTLTFKGKPVEMVLAGETFGEMAAIAGSPRSATATARKNCRALALDEKQFMNSLQKMPEFALMLMSVMAQRLRRSVAKLAEVKNIAVSPLVHEHTLDKKVLEDLLHELGNPPQTFAEAGKNVITQGAVASCMFVVTKGRIAISIDGLVIEYVGPGAVFGEMALVDRSGRFATATAQTDSAWILIDREDFLAMVKSKPAFGIALMRSMSERVQHIGSLLRG